MNEQQNIEQLFQKFIDNTITKEEYEILMRFIKNYGSEEKVKKMLDAYWKRLKTLDGNESESTIRGERDLFNLITSRIDYTEKTTNSKKSTNLIRKKKATGFYKIAASVIIIFGAFFFYKQGMVFRNTVPPSNTLTNPNSITLKLDNGNIEVVSENQHREITDVNGNVVGHQNGSQLNYSTKTNLIKELVYNELTVPYGKRFDLVLSDGTKVTVNAGTSIKYPVQFIRGKNRKVYIEGEAYFDVIKDLDHPFVVNANEINVEVLGTQFNMSSYPEDSSINTVLVEGSVRLFEEAKRQNPESYTLLTPGNMAAWDKSQKDISIDKVDVEIYTSWKDGVMLFKRTPFSNIMKKLERYYDITIENKYQFLESQVYTASFNNESIEEVMDAFKEDTPFEYHLENKKLIITQLK